MKEQPRVPLLEHKRLRSYWHFVLDLEVPQDLLLTWELRVVAFLSAVLRVLMAVVVFGIC